MSQICYTGISTETNVIEWYNQDFEICRFEDFRYKILSKCPVDQERGRDKIRLNELFIMIDTETSKSKPDIYTERIEHGVTYKDYKENPNYVVKWSIAIGVYGFDIAVIWGDKPSDLIKTIRKIHNSLKGNRTIFYCHNLSYDILFLRKFFYREFGYPKSQLNTKPHYPINIVFDNGVVIRDSLILAQRSIEKWGNDLNVIHKKAVGKWDYDVIRNQKDPLNSNQLEYICNDVLCGIECLDKLRRTIKKTYAGMPYTATGIPRSELREVSKSYDGHKKTAKMYTTYEQYLTFEKVYHGGYTHANRNMVNTILENVTCFDFASSYPYCLLAYKFPMEKFSPLGFEPTPEFIKQGAENEAYIMTVEATNVKLKDYWFPMPCLQLSKVNTVLDPIIDNGRILECGYVNITLTEVDFLLFMEYYSYSEIRIYDVSFSCKDYLPRWITDYVYGLYRDKSFLKTGDQVLYNIAKAKLNSCYGMMVQKLLKMEILEDYATGEYSKVPKGNEAEFTREVNKQNTILFYPWGVYTTCYAMRNLFELGKCAKDVQDWIYSDTDSAYFTEFNEEKIKAYNNNCKKILTKRGYGAVKIGNKEYWLGCAEKDGEYSEFIAQHSKCYACREKETGQLKITVAGVPKKAGAKCLNDNLDLFREGFIFDGNITNKKTHIFQYVDSIYIDERGNEVGDSINLIPCDYSINTTVEQKIDELLHEEVDIQIYDDID